MSEKAIFINELDLNFAEEIASQPGGENIKRCFACGTCAAGCPITEIDENYNCRRIIRQILLGMREGRLNRYGSDSGFGPDYFCLILRDPLLAGIPVETRERTEAALNFFLDPAGQITPHFDPELRRQPRKHLPSGRTRGGSCGCRELY